MKTTFEQSLCQAVKRLSKANFDESIREVIEHHQDLCNEALASGKPPEQSVQLANRRIGVIGDIARKIVDTPARLTSGKWLQFVGIALWILVPTLLEYFSLYGGLFPRTYSTIFVGGLVMALGWFSSSKIEGKALAIGSLCLILMGIRLFIILDSQTGSPNSAHVAMTIIRARFLSFLIGFGSGAAILRLYYYRLDALKLRLTRN